MNIVAFVNNVFMLLLLEIPPHASKSEFLFDGKRSFMNNNATYGNRYSYPKRFN